MEIINQRLYELSKRINKKYHLFNNEQLEVIKTTSHEDVIKISMMLLDFTLKEKCFTKYKYFFDSISDTIEQEKKHYHNVKLMVDWLKNHGIGYRITGGAAIDIALNNGKFYHDISIIDIYEKNMEFFMEELYSLGGDTLKCYDDGYFKPSFTYKLEDCESVIFLEDGARIGVRVISKNENKELCFKSFENSPNGIITYEKRISDEEYDLCFKETDDGIKVQSLESIYVDKISSYSDENFIDLLTIAPYVDYDIIKRIKILPKSEVVVKEKSDKNGLSKIS